MISLIIHHHMHYRHEICIRICSEYVKLNTPHCWSVIRSTCEFFYMTWLPGIRRYGKLQRKREEKENKEKKFKKSEKLVKKLFSKSLSSGRIFSHNPLIVVVRGIRNSFWFIISVLTLVTSLYTRDMHDFHRNIRMCK